MKIVDKNDYAMAKLVTYSNEIEKLKKELKTEHEMRMKEQNSNITLTCLLISSIALNVLFIMFIIM